MRNLPYYNLLGDREAKFANSETYKKHIRSYLEARGYVFVSDSKVEGHLPDLIFLDNATEINREIWVEAKWSKFSFNDTSFLDEFSRYLIGYFVRNPEDRFRLMIFARNTMNQKFHKTLLNKLSEKEIQTIMNKILPLVKDSIDKELLTSLTLDDLKGFFGKIDLYQSDIDSLKLKVEQIIDEKFDPSNIFSRFQNMKELLHIEPKKEMIISNLVPITGIETIWKANTKYRLKEEIFEEIDYAPPFVLYEGSLLSLCSFERNNNLISVVDETSIQKIDLKEMIQKRDNHRIIIHLLNSAANQLCRHRGLYVDNKIRWFYPLQYPKYSKRTVKWKKENRFYTRTVASAKKNFCYHISVFISSKVIDSELFYCILPQKTFTENGKSPVSASSYKRIERSYRKSIMGYNPNALNDILFWHYVIFDHFDIYTSPLNQTDKQRENQHKTKNLILRLNPLELEKLNVNMSPIENHMLVKKFERSEDYDLSYYLEELDEN